jgi:hypothetical protein
MKYQPNNTRKMLEQRIAAIKEFLDRRLGDIVAVRSERAGELKWYTDQEKEINDKLEHERSSQAVNAQQYRAVIDECNATIAEAEVRRDFASKRMVESAALYKSITAELGESLVRHSKRAEPIRSKWRQRLRLFQDGLVRRKRHELAKLERRLADKMAKAAARKGLVRLTSEEIALGMLPGEKTVDA